MAIFDQKPAPRKDAAPFGAEPPRDAQPAAADAGAGAVPAAPRAPGPSGNESLIAADLTIEGKIEGNGNLRIAGKFKGDITVQGDLTVEKGARLTGGVRARRVVIAGELEGNIEGAQQVELQQGGVLVGDVKAGAMTVAPGARMRGQADFGWNDKAGDGATTGGFTAA